MQTKKNKVKKIYKTKIETLFQIDILIYNDFFMSGSVLYGYFLHFPKICGLSFL